MNDAKKKTRYQNGQSDERPWGHWKVVESGDTFTVKRIEVAPGQRLSLQYHHHRAEHWVVVAGSGEVTLGDDLCPVSFGSHIHVPREIKHRIHNSGDEPLVFIEVQFGEIMDEDDIVRLEDDYQRSHAG